MDRRDFLKTGGLAAAATAPFLGGASRRALAIQLDGHVPEPVARAADALTQTLRAHGYTVTPRAPLIIHAALDPKAVPESFTLSRHGDTVAVTGDARGLSYALYEVARRVRTGADLGEAVTEKPLNPVRSIMRQFTCEAYDKPWFYDRDQWPAYIAMLAEARFNRLHLAFGLAYDQLGKVRDSYFLFTYPFLLDVPGYKVSVSGLSPAERERNLDTLRFISEQTVAHGLDFQLGLWMHGYEWPAVPGVPTIEGLTAETHAAYCHDAMAELLKELPAVTSVGLRIHGESGVKEGSYDFWKSVFTGVAASGRPIEIDLHAKGVDQTMIDTALSTGLPVNAAPKYWGEHLGMPYHQAAIRELEMPQTGKVGRGLMTLSEGARSFTRYGYADLLRDDRKFTVRHRIFPGTQRLLASAPAPEYGAMFTFCGSTGADIMEPLTYRGRRGSSTNTPRDGYAVRKMAAKWDWQRYAAWYEGFGRGMYNPQTVPVQDLALAAAGRILPLITTVHAAAAACDGYWPEVYWNQSLITEVTDGPYRDQSTPRVFDNVSPFDPQLFSSPREHAAELLGTPSAKISPVQAATWLEALADEAEAAQKPAHDVDSERQRIDVAIQVGLGRFFAAKLRAGVLFALYRQSQDGRALTATIAHYEKARDAWAGIVKVSDGVYGDLGSSDVISEHGNWADKLAMVDADINAVKALNATPGSDPRVAAAIGAAQAKIAVPEIDLQHTPSAGFTPGQAVAVTVSGALTGARLLYRHVNQGERWQSLDMTASGNTWTASIPADYTASPYPLQYYVEVQTHSGPAQWPGLTMKPKHLPYVMLHKV